MSSSQVVAAPYVIAMKSDTLFVVDDKEVPVGNLVKALNKAKVSKAEPLVIESSASFESIRTISRILATAGYKPFFKKPRQAKVVSGAPRTKGMPQTISK